VVGKVVNIQFEELDGEEESNDEGAVDDGGDKGSADKSILEDEIVGIIDQTAGEDVGCCEFGLNSLGYRNLV